MGLKLCGFSYLNCRLYSPPLWNVGFYSCRANLLFRGRQPHMDIKVSKVRCPYADLRGWGRGYVSLQENSVGLQLRDWLLLFDLGILSTVQTFQDNILFDWKLSVHQFICKKPIFRLLNCICCCWNSPKIIFNFEKLRSSPPMRFVTEFQMAAHTAHRSLQGVILLKQKPGLLSTLYFPVA